MEQSEDKLMKMRKLHKQTEWSMQFEDTEEVQELTQTATDD